MATKLQIGASNPLTLDDKLLEAYRKRVANGEDANAIAIEFFQKATSEIQASQKRLAADEGTYRGGYETPDELAAKYGLINSSQLGLLGGQKTNTDTGVLALAAALKNMPQPTQYDPVTKQVIAGTEIPQTTFGTNNRAEEERKAAELDAAYRADLDRRNAPAQAAYNQRLAAMNSQTIQQGIKNIPQVGTTAYTNYLLGGNYFAEGTPDNPSGQIKPFTPTTGGFNGNTGTISASNLQGNTAPIPVAKSTYNTTQADAVAAGADMTSKSIDDYVKLLTPPETAESREKKGLYTEIKEKLRGVEGRGNAQLEEEKKRGVEEKKQTLLNYQTQLKQKTAEYAVKKAKYEALEADVENKPITMNSIIGGQAQIKRAMQAELNVAAAEIDMIQAAAAGAMGNLDLALSEASRAVDLRYSDIQDAIDVRLKQIELMDKEMDEKERARAAAVELYLNDQRSRVNAAMDYEKDKNATLLNAISRYPDANISLNDSIETANQKITNNSRIYREQVRPPVSSTETEVPTQSITALKNALNESKFQGAEADGKYADPNLYLVNYNSYPDKAEFLRLFPPSTYINPANTWLPAEIMQFTKKDSGSDDGPLFQ